MTLRSCWVTKIPANRRLVFTIAAIVLCWLTSLAIDLQDSDGEKSDDLVVDVSNEVGCAAPNLKWHGENVLP